MPRVNASIVVAVVLAVVARGGAAQESAPPAVVFEGFGLGDLSAGASVAQALRSVADPALPTACRPLDVFVRGPGAGREATAPLAAEIRSRVEAFDVAAGFEGDAASLAARVPRWTGRIRLGEAGPTGSDAIELRTRLDACPGLERLGVELGPRFERRLPNGARVFFDGAASAEAFRSADGGGWQLPGTSTADSLTAVGISARTGIVR